MDAYKHTKMSFVDLKTLFSQNLFYFPQIGSFNNVNLNPSRFSFENLKVLITRCGGIILHSHQQLKTHEKQGEKTIMRVKCDPKFDRTDTDMKITMA